MASGASDKFHVLTVDYRGFGYSTGNPTERGIIDDGIALVNWAMNVARVPSNRIMILGQSLGAAVATAVAEHFVVERQVEFSGIVLVAAFTDIPTLILSYSIGGLIPILSPLRPYPVLQNFFAKRVQDTWKTKERLANLVRKSKNVDVTLIHSQDDFEIPWQHSENLFYAATNATTEQGDEARHISTGKYNEDFGDAGWSREWIAKGHTYRNIKLIRLEVVRHGGKLLFPYTI